ncbi:hypothetical protein [Clostridium perfringens]
MVENAHEAIIDKDTYLKSQELDQMDIRMSPKGRNVCLFSGFLKCDDC